MTTPGGLLEHVELFTPLTAEERGQLEVLSTLRSIGAGESVYAEGDAGDALYIVRRGAVELLSRVAEGVERRVIVVRPGQCFGLVEALDPSPRSVSARAVEASECVEIPRSALVSLSDQSDRTAGHVLLALSMGMARQLRAAVELVRQNLAWTLQVSGASDLELGGLVEGAAEISVELSTGRRLEGTLLKVDSGTERKDLLLRTGEGRTLWIPYHAVVSITAGDASGSATTHAGGEHGGH